MGFMDSLKGIAGAKPGVSVLSKEELIAKLLDLNNEDYPYKIEKIDDSNLLAQWIIIETSLYKINAVMNREKVLKIRLLLDESEHKVRMLEVNYSISYRAGIPDSSSSGNVHQYRFNVPGMRRAIAKTVTEYGWDFISAIPKKDL